MEDKTNATAQMDEVKKKFNLPDNALPIVITFLTPGDTPEEFKVGIFINEQQPMQLIKNTLDAVNEILSKKPVSSMTPGGQSAPRKPTLKDFIED